MRTAGIQPSLSDLHLGHQSINEAVNVRDSVVRESGSGLVPHYLMHGDRDAVLGLSGEGDRRY